VMTKENMTRGTGDFGAMCTAMYGFRMLDFASNLVHVECLKLRDADDERPRPFNILAGPPGPGSLLARDKSFALAKRPGECGFLEEEWNLANGGAKKSDKAAAAEALLRQGKTLDEVQAQLKIDFGEGMNRKKLSEMQQAVDLQKEI